jgi:hypothetical protein
MPDTMFEAATTACEAAESAGAPFEASPKPLLLSTEATRRWLSCSKIKLFELIRGGDREAVQLGSRRLVVASSVQQLVERLRQSAP